MQNAGVTDYGQDLLFGTFLTPTAATPHRVVELARLTEDCGLDLVTLQDHPYQPRFLDTWTLLSYMAADTRRVRLAPNVANLPLRPPAVLARSAASLDLLSGGRLELGLGAGAFWDAIEAMGGGRLPVGRRVPSVQQAMAVIHGIWSAGDRSPLRAGGDIHHVNGAKRGPAPAHPIEIWLGAYGPRMLELTGRAADGWLPSAGYLKPGQLAAGQAAVDAAALAAGRDPATIRRLLNISGEFGARGSSPLHGPAAQWAQELAELALVDGVSAFILGSDEPADIERFGQEVAPAVRELVLAERSAGAAGYRGDSNGSGPTVAGGFDASSTGTNDAVPTGNGAADPSTISRNAIRLRTDDGLRLTPASDDGVRLTDPVWDEASRPHRHFGRADADDGGEPVRYTALGRSVGQHLIDIHDHLRTELAQVRDLIEQVRTGAASAARARSEINAMTMRQNNWTLGAYCAAYCRLVAGHHGLEDASVFPHLRALDGELAPVLDRLTDEHLIIHEILEAVDRALVAFVGRPDDFTQLQRCVDQLTDSLRSHLSYEEHELVEPLARLGFYPGQLAGL